MDSSVHACSGGGHQQQQMQGNSSPQQNTPEITPTSVLGEIATFVAAHGEKLSDAKFETVGKIYISRMMSRR